MLERSDDDLIARTPSPGRDGRGHVGSDVARWLDHFPAERIFIGFHEDIERDPAEFLDRLCTFIGASPFPARWHGLLRQNVNSSARGLQPSPRVKRRIAQDFLDETRLLAERVGGPAIRWLDDAEACIRVGPIA